MNFILSLLHKGTGTYSDCAYDAKLGLPVMTGWQNCCEGGKDFILGGEVFGSGRAEFQFTSAGWELEAGGDTDRFANESKSVNQKNQSDEQ